MERSNGDEGNQLLYREVNKRIREVSDAFGSDGRVEFLCECGRDDCTATFELTQAQFDGFVRNSGYLLLAPRHRGSLTGQPLIAEYEGFLVVSGYPDRVELR